MVMLLPLYTHPLEDPLAWQAVARAGSALVVVVNVHNGPGASRDDAYVQVTDRLNEVGIPMLGYVDLAYLRRGSGEIWCDMVGWAQYPVAGIFFDQVPSGRDDLAEVTRIARAARGMVVLNPGTRPHPGYAAIADMVCTFEGSWRTYASMPAVPDWPNAAHLVYGVPADEVAAAEAMLRTRVHNGLVTDLEAAQPYRGLPPRLRDHGLRSATAR